MKLTEKELKLHSTLTLGVLFDGKIYKLQLYTEIFMP